MTHVYLVEWSGRYESELMAIYSTYEAAEKAIKNNYPNYLEKVSKTGVPYWQEPTEYNEEIVIKIMEVL